MANIHYASLLDYKAFQAEVYSLTEQVDSQNYEPLRQAASTAIQQFQQEWPLQDHGIYEYQDGEWQLALSQEWPLFEHGGGNLPTSEKIENIFNPQPRDIGQWFLILLAQHLKPCPSSESNWYVLSTALSIAGWPLERCDLLFKGLPTSKLLKPQIEQRSPWPLAEEHPYWLWLHPWNARSGWLPKEQIRQLHNNLGEMQDAIKQLDIRRFPGINIDNPVVIEDFRTHLDKSYSQTMAMLSMAVESSSGLFMSITSYA